MNSFLLTLAALKPHDMSVNIYLLFLRDACMLKKTEATNIIAKMLIIAPTGRSRHLAELMEITEKSKAVIMRSTAIILRMDAMAPGVA